MQIVVLQELIPIDAQKIYISFQNYSDENDNIFIIIFIELLNPYCKLFLGEGIGGPL